MHAPSMSKSSRVSGFGLIEVLVAVLLVSIGLLGAAGMHVRAVEYTMDTERRQMAAMVASELMETMRSDTTTVLQATGAPKSDLGGYTKAKDAALPTVTTADCMPLSSDPGKRLGCWGVRAKRVIPELPDALITSAFTVGVDAMTNVVAITVAWPVKKGQCLNATGNDDDYCTYTLRSRL